MNLYPILYSFRRCPYAMRARMGIAAAGLKVELREIVFSDKPKHLLEISPKGTVPVLQLVDGTVIDESFDILMWALEQNDPEGWLDVSETEKAEGLTLIKANDDEFKQHLDRYKYPSRYDLDYDLDSGAADRDKAMAFLDKLSQRLKQRRYLLDKQMCFADVGVFSFIRQFRAVDVDWFDRVAEVELREWLNNIVLSPLFLRVMHKFPVWLEGKDPVFL